MDAKGFFSQVIDKNYKEWKADPDDFTKYWNAAVSMNTAAEFLALHRAGYPELTRTEVDVKVAAIRSEYPELKAIKLYANPLKHVRSHDNQKLTASSTSIAPENPNSWQLTSSMPDPRDTLDRAFARLSSMPEFK